jgi:hypothetical protein
MPRLSDLVNARMHSRFQLSTVTIGLKGLLRSFSAHPGRADPPLGPLGSRRGARSI